MREFSDKTAPYQIPLEAYGIEMRVCTNSPELLERVRPILPPGWSQRPRSSSQIRIGLLAEDDEVYSIYSDASCVHDAPGLHYALTVMHQTIEAHVSFDAPGLIFVHAGVVADGKRAIVMPGLSFSGKTTLVRALIEAGAVYYSDEFAVLDGDGRVHPYSRPLAFRPPDGGVVQYQVEELGGVVGVEPLPVGLVVATRYRPGAEWNPRELSPGAGALALLEHAIPARDRPEETLRVLTKAVSGATVLEGERGEASEFTGILLDTMRAVA